MEIIHGDALEIIPTLDDESIDCVITDPPYGIDFSTTRYRNDKYSVMPNDDDIKVAIEVLEKIGRVMKENTHAYFFTRWDVYPLLVSHIPEELSLSSVIIWNKGAGGHGMGDLDIWAPQYEMIMFLMKGKRKIVGRRLPNVLTFQDIRFTGEKKYHPVQKPINLIKTLIVKSSNKSEVVLDPFAGSGTTLVAAKKCGRNAIGIELCEEYCKIIEERLKRTPHRSVAEVFGGSDTLQEPLSEDEKWPNKL